jgi:hypothetical protein
LLAKLMASQTKVEKYEGEIKELKKVLAEQF